jgi:hypothetical protein
MKMAMDAAKPAIGEEIGGPGKAYFDQVVTDNIVDALLELAAETWTTRDRLLVLEEVLAGQGIDLPRLIEAHVPSEALKAERKQQREAFIAQVFASFSRRTG